VSRGSRRQSTESRIRIRVRIRGFLKNPSEFVRLQDFEIRNNTKYKIAITLLHTVHKTRNQKTVRKEMIGKGISFEAVPKKNSVGAEVTSSGRLFQPLGTHDRQQWTVV